MKNTTIPEPAGFRGLTKAERIRYLQSRSASWGACCAAAYSPGSISRDLKTCGEA